MGWLCCYGSRNNEKKDSREPVVGQDSGSKSLASHHAKVQPDNMKSAPSADTNKDPFKDGTTNVSMESGLVSSTPVSSIPADVIRAHVFSFQELAAAAKNFRSECLIGEGGFGPVYKGRLENGQEVAIKQLDRNGLQGNREFLVEVLMLSLLHHQNLVNLVGYCADGEQRLLVYEFMPLGSLEDHLHGLPPDKEPLDWTTRMKIATGAAKGLQYLHEIANPPVIYRDLKSSNILLGEDFHPKLSDFGLAKLGPVGDKTHVSTRVMGTYGYCAPEYAMTGQLTLKSDVYSFGVVLLELITGRKAIDQTRPSGEHNLVAWARPLFKDRSKFSQMADPNLHGQFPVRGLFQALAVAAMCLHEQATSRPVIADVVTALYFLASQTCGPVLHPARKTEMVSPVSGHEQDKVKLGSAYELVQDTNFQQVKDATSGNNFPLKIRGDQSDAQAVRGVEVRNTSTQPGWRTPTEGREREQAIAEARIWGESWREKRGCVKSEGDCSERTSG